MGWDNLGWDGTGTETSGMGGTGTEKNIFAWDGMGLGHKFKQKCGMGWDASHPIYIPGTNLCQLTGLGGFLQQLSETPFWSLPYRTIWIFAIYLKAQDCRASRI